MFFDFVPQGEAGAGVLGGGGGELLAEGGEGAGAAGRGERVQPDGEAGGAGDDVAAGGEGFADQGVRLVVCAGVGAVQRAGQDRLGVAGGHPDGVGDQLGLEGFSRTMSGLRGESGIFAGMALAAALASSSRWRAAVTGASSLASCWLVMWTPCPGAGVRILGPAWRRGRPGRRPGPSSRVYGGFCGFLLFRVRDLAALVLGGDGVGVQGVEGEVVPV